MSRTKKQREEEDDICITDFEKDHVCRHEFHDGSACMNVASPREHFCRWHRTAAEREARRIAYAKRRTKNAIRDLQIPMIEDPESLQLAIHEVMDAIIDGRVKDRRAGHLLYALQLAQSNLKGKLFLRHSKYDVFNLMNDLEDALQARQAARKPPQSAPAPTEVEKKQS